MTVEIDKGKDFSLDEAEVKVTGEPGTYVSLSTANYDLYKRGAHTFLTEHKVKYFPCAYFT